MSAVTRRPIALLVLALACGGGFAIWAAQQDGGAAAPTPRVPAATESAEELGGYPRSQFHIDHDRFLPATDPAVVDAVAARFLSGDDEVYGVVIDGHARAYPTRMLSYHHVVNDMINGIPIAVTY